MKNNNISEKNNWQMKINIYVNCSFICEGQFPKHVS